MKGNRSRTPTRQAGRVVANRSRIVRKATTYRLEPRVQEGLALLGSITKTPANRMVNEAVGAYVASRTAELEADLATTLHRVREYRSADPGFESAIAEFVRAEAGLAGELRLDLQVEF
jgi:hypothetical protein